MTRHEASRLAPGQTVWTKNGPYVQKCQVVQLEWTPRTRDWKIAFIWYSPDGALHTGEKRRQAVYLDNPIAPEGGPA